MLVNQEAKEAANRLAKAWSTSQVYPNYMDENEVKVFKIIRKKSERYDPILIENKKKMANTVQVLCPNVKITVVVSELPNRWHVEATIKSSKRKDMGNIYPLNKVAIHFMNDGRFIFGFSHGVVINRYITRDVLKMRSLMLRLSKLGFDSTIKKDYRHIVVFTKPVNTEIKYNLDCRECDGLGFQLIDGKRKPCEACKGDGQSREEYDPKAEGW